MNDFESDQKAKAQQQFNQEQGYGEPQAQDVSRAAKNTASQPRMSLADMLRHDLHATDRHIGKIGRALDIIERHPEFLEYIDLQRLLNELGTPYK